MLDHKKCGNHLMGELERQFDNVLFVKPIMRSSGDIMFLHIVFR